MKNSWLINLLPLFITYVAVKAVHWLVGFDYHLFREGLFHSKLLIDLASWGIIYAIVYYLLKTFMPKKKNTA